jgi:hypothetical protein
MRMFDKYMYFSVIESNYTSRCTTRRGSNATRLTDSTLDIETIVFNETVMALLKTIRDRLPIIASNISIFQPSFISNIFPSILESLNKEELFKYIGEKIEKNASSLDVKARQTFFSKGWQDFSSWLGYRSTSFTLCKHVTKVYMQNVAVIFQLTNSIK